MMKTVLITGFDPFNGESLNPAWEAVRQLDGWNGDGFRVVARQLPTVFGRANTLMAEAIAELAPQLVIAVGQAGGRSDLTIERIAINVDDASIADNAQQQPVDRGIAPDGPAAYFSTLPIKAMVRALRACGLPASVSQTAGTFVCNHVFYGLMHYLATRAVAPGSVAPDAAAPQVRAGFIHIPYLPQQAAAHPGAPSMALADLVLGLRRAVEVALAQTDDIAETGGSTH